MTALELDPLFEHIPAPGEPLAHFGMPGEPLAQLVAPGRITELCGSAQTTAAVSILAQAQREGETAAWIQPVRGELYPPDLEAFGVDVGALVVIHVPEAPAANQRPRRAIGLGSQPTTGGQIAGPSGQCRAAELLLRSGGFGLVVIDFCHDEPRGSTAWQGRLLGLARQHEARLVLLRRSAREQPASLGPLVGLRLASHVARAPAPNDPPGFTPRTGRFELRHEVLKNKSGGPVAPAPAHVRGPWGLL
ncbi:MAG: hypothetical protein KC431_30230 [Myxococcales bacterium]|nr:hypothetical protein [Myxococcales bacterium]